MPQLVIRIFLNISITIEPHSSRISTLNIFYTDTLFYKFAKNKSFMELDQIHTLKGQKMNQMDCPPYHSRGLDKKRPTKPPIGKSTKVVNKNVIQ